MHSKMIYIENQQMAKTVPGYDFKCGLTITEGKFLLYSHPGIASLVLGMMTLQS